MTIVLAIFAGLVGGALGWVVTAFGYIVVAQALGASTMEGALAMGAFFGIGPIGGVVAAVASAWVVIKARKGRDGRRANKYSLITGLVLAAGMVGGYLYLFYEPPSPHFDFYQTKPTLHYEIKVPKASIREDSFFKIRVEVGTWQTFLNPDRPLAVKIDGDTAVISGRTTLAFRVNDRVLNVWLSADKLYLFDLPLAKKPKGRASFNEWRRVDRIDHRREARVVPARSEDRFYLRTKVSWPPAQ